jgi:hypothetical protein
MGCDLNYILTIEIDDENKDAVDIWMKCQHDIVSEIRFMYGARFDMIHLYGAADGDIPIFIISCYTGLSRDKTVHYVFEDVIEAVKKAFSMYAGCAVDVTYKKW